MRMLRYYQGHGLIEPDYVNESSGRRFYRAEQVKEAALVMRLRAAGFSVRSIAQVLPVVDDPAHIAVVLARHHADLAAKSAAVHQELANLDRLRAYLKGHPEMSEVKIETLPSLKLATVRRVIDSYDAEGELWNELMDLLRHSDAVLPASGLSGATFHDSDYRDSGMDIEVWVEVTESFEPPQGLGFSEQPECEIVSATLRGDYSQVPAVTQEIGKFIAERNVETGPMFNIYHVGPAQNPDPTSWVTQLCFPLRASQ